jgi:hypothetical protein
MAVYRDFEQARGHAVAGEVPLLVIKENHSEPLAIIPLDHFLTLVRNQNKNK